MDDKRKRKKKAGAVLAVLVFAPLLYVASVGPAVAWVAKPHGGDHAALRSRIRIYVRVYAPLLAAEERSEAVQAAMDRWRKLFLDEEAEVRWNWINWDLDFWRRLGALPKKQNSNDATIKVPIDLTGCWLPATKLAASFWRFSV